MKRLMFTSLFFLILCFAGFGNRGYALQAGVGIHTFSNVAKNLSKKANESLAVMQFQKTNEEAGKNKYIDELLSQMSLEEKLSQMIILTNPKDITEAGIENYKPGGIIYFALDFNGKTVEQVNERTALLQSKADIGMLVGVDEEGGAVSRIKGMRQKDIPVFQGARQLWKDGDKTAVADDTQKKMEFLKQMGINLNFGPVADVSGKGSYMYLRSAGDDGETVAAYVETVLDIMEENNMTSCLKHFPGYGNNANTHKVYTVDNRSFSDYEATDFIPFEAGIKKGTDMVMVSHIVMKSVDGEAPASMSQKVHELLRNDMDFEGIIIADDLNMQAILSKMSIEEASQKAVEAGNDMIFSSDYNASINGMKNAVGKGLVTEDRIDESVRRIIRLKIKREIIEAP